MKKFNYLLGAAAMMFAMVFTSCSNEDLPTPGIFNGDDLSTAIANHTEIVNGVPVVTLPAGVTLTVNEAIELNAPLLITCKSTTDLPIIKMGKDGKFVTLAGIQFTNVGIDASEQTSPLVTVGKTEPAEWSLCPVGFENVVVSGLKKALVYAACKKYETPLVVNDCRIQVAADVTVFDYTKGSVAPEFIIENSSICAPTATTKAFYSSQGGQKATEISDDAIQEFEFANSTFYNLAKTKNFFTHRQSNQKWLSYEVKNCIFVNCGKSGQAIKGMNGGQGGANPIWNISGNVFNFDGADTSADEATGDDNEPVANSKAVVVNFADPDNGDFSQSDVKAGDPFWYE